MIMNTIYPWQLQNWQNVLAQFRQNRMPHAFMFLGPSGIGKIDFARALAQRILCDEVQASEYACGQCRSCKLYVAENHPDFYAVFPEEKAKVIKIQQLRELIEKLGSKSQRGGYQVALIYPAEAMNRSAANALLKTLEEPAGQVLIILICHQSGLIPATIFSRCQKIFFAAYMDDATLTWLQQRIDTSIDARLLLRLAGNAPLQAVHLSESNYLKLRDQVLYYLLDIQQQQVHPISLVETWIKQDVAMVMQVIVSVILDIVRLQLNVSIQYITNQDRMEPLQIMSRVCERIKLQRFLNDVQSAQQLLSNSILHANEQLLLESVFIKWTYMGS